jgi:hypothetical protein
MLTRGTHIMAGLLGLLLAAPHPMRGDEGGTPPVSGDEATRPKWLQHGLSLAAEPDESDRERLLMLSAGRGAEFDAYALPSESLGEAAPAGVEVANRPELMPRNLLDPTVGELPAYPLPYAERPDIPEGIDLDEILKGRGPGVHGSVFFGVDSEGGWRSGLSVGTDIVPGKVHLEVRTEVGKYRGYSSPWDD